MRISNLSFKTRIILVGTVVAAAAILFKFELFKIHKFSAPISRPRVEYSIPRDRVKKAVLSNGMTVLVYENRHFPKVLMQIVYNIGSGVEESGERGLAHLIEHMIFKGTKKLSEGDIDSIARKYGASYNAYTSYDETSYYFLTNRNNWKPFMDILADCMVNACFDDQHLASEMKAVIQELRMLKDNYTRSMSDKALKNLYPSNHPYHDPIIGYKEDLLSFSASDLRKFYKKYYTPDKAFLFIVGDVDGNEAISFAKKHFEHIPRGEDIKEKLIPQNLVDIATQTDHIYRDVKKELLAFYWKIPGLKEKNNVLTSVVNSVIGGGDSSILYRRLVDEEQVALSAGTQAVQLKESGVFFVAIQPKEGKRDVCRNIVIEELKKVIDGELEKKEVVKVARSAERAFFRMLQRNVALAGAWIDSYLSTGDEYELFGRVDDYYNVNKESVIEFVKKHIDPFLMNEIVLLPIPEEKKAMWLENQKREEETDKKILERFQRTAPLENPWFVQTMPDPIHLDFVSDKPERTVELSSGLKIIMSKRSYFPLISLFCNFKESSFLSNAKISPSLNIMMEMLGEGSQRFTKRELLDFFNAYGPSISFGSGGSSLSTVNVGFEPVFKRWLHVLTEPKFDKDALEKLKDAAIDGYERAKDNPFSVANDILSNMIYKDHPYGHTIDDAIAQVKKLTVDDMKKLHKTYVSPKNMRMVVVGDFDLDEMEKTIRHACRNWNGGEYQKAVIKKGDFVPSEKRDHEMLRDQVALSFGRTSPIDVYHPDRTPLRILNNVCFSGLGSRIYELRERTGLFYSASGGIGVGSDKNHGIDFVGALLSLDKVETAEKELLALIDQFGKDGMKKHELDDVRQIALNSTLSSYSSEASIAAAFAYLEEFNLGFDYNDKVLKRIQTISLEELNQIAKKYFNSKDFSRVRVGRVSELIDTVSKPEK